MITDPRQPPPFWVLVLCVALGPFCFNGILAGLPDITTTWAISYTQASLLMSGFMFASALCPLIYGPVSDTTGRRPVLLFGFSLNVAASLMAALVPSYELLLVARVVQGFGAGVGFVIVRAMVRDCYPPEKTAGMIATITMAMVVVPIVTPLVSGFIVGIFGWRACFYVMGTGALITLFCVVFWGRETHGGHPFSLTALLTDYTTVMRQKVFWWYSLLLVFASGIFFSFMGAAPHAVISLLGYSEQQFGAFFILSGAGYIGGNYTASRFMSRWGIHRMIWIGLLITLIGTSLTAGLAFAGVPITIYSIFGPMIFVGYGNGLVLPALMGAAVSGQPRYAGTASGLSGFSQFFGGGLLMNLASWLVIDHVAPLLYLMLTLNVIALLILGFGVLLVRHHTKLAQAKLA